MAFDEFFHAEFSPNYDIYFVCLCQKMIVEQSANKKPLATNLSHNFIEVEENAIYYIHIWICN